MGARARRPRARPVAPDRPPGRPRRARLRHQGHAWGRALATSSLAIAAGLSRTRNAPEPGWVSSPPQALVTPYSSSLRRLRLNERQPSGQGRATSCPPRLKRLDVTPDRTMHPTTSVEDRLREARIRSRQAQNGAGPSLQAACTPGNMALRGACAEGDIRLHSSGGKIQER